MKYLLTILSIWFATFSSKAQTTNPKINFDDYENLVKEVKAHRQKRLLSLNDFLKKSKEANVIILDTRSDKLYQSRHLAGAKHLNFSDFTQANLARLIPDKNTIILIYCNNNFDEDEINFATKAVFNPSINTSSTNNSPSITLALNIPTYINLYGYGYKNVYELADLVSVNDGRLKFEGAK